MCNNPRFVITLVHGTFARRSKWANPNSDFANSISALLAGSVVIHTHSWTGANTQKARRRASAQLAQQLIQQLEAYPLAAHFIIGHSHGGNVALFASNDPAVQSRLSGILCINTPFIAVTARHTQDVVVYLVAAFALSLTIVLSMMVALFAVLGGLWLLRPETVEWTDPYHVLPYLIPLMMLVIWPSWLIFKSRARVDQYFQNKRDQMLHDTSLPKLEQPPIFCLWSYSDEIYGIFSSLEGLANLPHIFMHRFFSVIAFAIPAAYVLGKIVSVAIVLPNYLPQAHDWGMIAYDLGLIFFVLVAGLFAPVFTGLVCVFQYLVVLLLVAVPLNLLLRIIPVGISWRDIFSSFFVRLSFTLTPITARNVEFCEVLLRPRFLNHSAAYADMTSIAVMANWMKQKTATPGHAPAIERPR